MKSFIFFFFDPPFSDFDFYQNLKLIKKNKIYYKNHIVVIHRESKTFENFKNLLELLEIKVYGRSRIIFGVFT